jgi:hypothetical protein
MSTIRVLVGTKKGAFILTSDGKRQKWEVSGPFFAGWEIYQSEGVAGGSEPDLLFSVQRVVWADYSTVR